METGKNSAMEQKTLLARGMGRIAKALRRTAGNLQEENDPSTARYFDLAADRIGTLSATLEKKDLDALLAETSDFARKHPVMVFGGAVAVGLVASRLMKSSAVRRQYPTGRSETAAGPATWGESAGTPSESKAEGVEVKVESMDVKEAEKRKSRPYGAVKPGGYGSES